MLNLIQYQGDSDFAQDDGGFVQGYTPSHAELDSASREYYAIGGETLNQVQGDGGFVQGDVPVMLKRLPVRFSQKTAKYPPNGWFQRSLFTLVLFKQLVRMTISTGNSSNRKLSGWTQNETRICLHTQQSALWRAVHRRDVGLGTPCARAQKYLLPRFH